MTLGDRASLQYDHDIAEALELSPDKVRVTLEQKARGGITITATS